MAKANTDPFYKQSKSRGVVPCEEWDYFVVHELKSVTVRLLGPPICTSDHRYAIHCFDRFDGKFRCSKVHTTCSFSSPSTRRALVEVRAVQRHPTSASNSWPDHFRYFVSALQMTMLTHAEQVEMVGSYLNLGQIYKTGSDLHILAVAVRLGVWPKPVWPTKYQKEADAADPERLAADGVVLRFPSKSECR